MGLPKFKTGISVEEYLNGEEISQIRYEYINGEVYAMAGTSDKHNIIAGNIFANLWSHLKDSSCQTFIENMKVRVDVQTFYYPDLLVSCEENPESPYYRDEPILIVEVISPSTKQIDRREKLHAYRDMPSVVEYVIVEQEKMEVEIHRRQSGGNWITYFYAENDAEVTLESVDLTLPLSEIYRRVTFE